MSDIDIRKVIGRRVRELRIEKGWSQEELGRRAGGIAQTTIGNIERGTHDTGVTRLSAIADALGVTVGDLVSPPNEDGRRLYDRMMELLMEHNERSNPDKR